MLKTTINADSAQPQHKPNLKKKPAPHFNKENTQAHDNIKLNLDFQKYNNNHDEEERGDLRKSKEYKNIQHAAAESMDTIQKKQGFQYLQQTPDRFNESATLHTQFVNSVSASQSFVFQGSHHPIQSLNGMEFVGQSNYQNDTIDSNEIKGRKIDSPHLVVMREIKEQEEEDYLHDDIIGFGTGSDDMPNMIWNSRDLRHQQNQILNESLKRAKKSSKHSKSVENKKKAIKQQLSQGTKKGMFNDLKQANNRILQKGITSSREIRSSMGFHELLNQLDKDVSIQQSNLFDFKNRTVHDALKLELSGIRRSSNQGLPKNTLAKSANKNSKSGAKPGKSKEKLMQKGKKQNNQVFSYNFNQNSQQTPEKFLHQGATTASFLNSEHGRCVTSHGIQTSNSTLLLTKGHTKSQTNLGSHTNLINNKLNYPQTASNYNYNQRSSNSPDRNTLFQIKEFKPIGNIDKLIRDNLKKKGKIEVKERLQKQKSEETLKKKREDLEQKNNLVRQLNKDKTYKKQSYQQTLVHQQQASDPQGGLVHTQVTEGIEKLKKAWNESNHFKFKLKGHSQEPSQVLDFDVKKSKRFNFKNHRKSYGLEFIDIKREIQDELKTIEKKVYKDQHNQIIKQQFKQIHTDFSAKRLKVKQSSKQEVMEKRSSTERAPTSSKVIVVKKDKIRKFMKAKKKEFIHQQFQQQKDDYLRAQKMQDNLIKLNEFCKKKQHHKHPVLKIQKKRNATIQVKDIGRHTDDNRGELSKISLKVPQVNQEFQRQRSQDIGDDSSKISTEFYEEYFRLINSIKKEEKLESQQKATMSESIDLDRSLTHQRKKSPVKSPIGKLNDVQSPVSFNQATQFVQSPGQQVKQHRQNMKKSKSKGSMSKELTSGAKKKAGQQQRPPTASIRKTSKDNNSNQLKSTAKKSRAESAPLIQQLNSLNKQSLQSNHRVSSSSERLQYILYNIVKIQRFFRSHLQRRGFYQHFYFNHNLSDYDTEYYAGDTVKRIDTIEELKQMSDDYDEDDQDQDLEGEDEEEEDDDVDSDMIIINKKNPRDGDDQKKVIYMSNINSCSLPQTPKDPNQQNQQQEINKQIVFEYKVEDQFGSIQSQPVVQQISSQPSIFTQEVYQTQEEQKQDLPNDEYKMRIMAGSETMVKEFMHRTPKDPRLTLNLKDSVHKSLTHSLLSSQSSNRNQFHASVDSKSINEHTSQSSQSLFERNSFQQFTMSKLNQLSQNNEFLNLVKMREQALEYRQKKEGKILKRMCKNDQISPRTYNSRKESLEKWVQVEQEDISKTKKAFQEEWQKTVQMIEDTQKNVDLMRKKMKIQIDNNQRSNHHNALQFNSQSSRNSSSSNLATVQQDKRRSILEEEPPISQRSIRVFQFEGHLKEDKKEQKLIDFLEEKRQQKLNDSQQELLEILKPNQAQDSNRLVSRTGIYIEDQNDDKVMQASELLDPEEEEEFDSVIMKHKPEIIVDRDLIRSRSEQDLKEIINNQQEIPHDSFILDSSQRLHQALKSGSRTDLKIQENQSQDQQSSRQESFRQYDDLQSNDSILNETDLNNYFEEQKFTLDDFKSLDKKQLVEHKSQEEEGFSQRNQNEQLQQRRHRDIGIGMVVKTEPDQDDEDDEFEREFKRSQKVKTPEDQVQSLFHQHLLFSNAKPGENIKISDILKKNQSMQNQAIDPLNSFVQENTLSLSQSINPQLNNFVQPYPSSLADQLTEEILQTLLLQAMVVPQRNTVDHTLPQNLENQEVFIIEAQQSEKDQKRELIEFRQRYLMDQDIQKVDDYVNEVIASLLQSELEGLTSEYNLYTTDVPQFHKQFLQVLTNPVKRVELDLLNQLQTSEIGSYDHFETAQDPSQFPILPIDLYLEIERLREENQLKSMGEEDTLENSVVQESVHIMNKAVFDALNESLTKFRPYGIQGEPMPWSNRNRRLQTKVDINSVDTERLFQMVKSDVLRWSQTFAGCIPSQVFSFKKQINEADQFDEELFQETRERRLATMLAGEVVETEHQWLNYDFEEAQVKIDLSDMILEHLVEEMVQFMCTKTQVWQI